MFGNIDEIASSRSMVTVVAESSVDLLTVDTLKMYSIAEEYPELKKKMKIHVLTENLVRQLMKSQRRNAYTFFYRAMLESHIR